jgi:hypothetical protein
MYRSGARIVHVTAHSLSFVVLAVVVPALGVLAILAAGAGPSAPFGDADNAQPAGPDTTTSPRYFPLQLGNWWVYRAINVPADFTGTEDNCDGLLGSKVAITVEPPDGANRYEASRVLHIMKEHHCDYHFPVRHPWDASYLLAGWNGTDLHWNVLPPQRYDQSGPLAGSWWLAVRGSLRRPRRVPDAVGPGKVNPVGLEPWNLPPSYLIDPDYGFADQGRFVRDNLVATCLTPDCYIARVAGEHQPPYAFLPLTIPPPDDLGPVLGTLTETVDLLGRFQAAGVDGNRLDWRDWPSVVASLAQVCGDANTTGCATQAGQWYNLWHESVIVPNDPLLADMPAFQADPDAFVGKRLLRWRVFETFGEDPENTGTWRSCEGFWFVEDIGLVRIEETGATRIADCYRHDFNLVDPYHVVAVLESYDLAQATRPGRWADFGFDSPSAMTVIDEGQGPQLLSTANGYAWRQDLATGNLLDVAVLARQWADAPRVISGSVTIGPWDDGGPTALDFGLGHGTESLFGAPLLIVNGDAFWLYDWRAANPWVRWGHLVELLPPDPPVVQGLTPFDDGAIGDLTALPSDADSLLIAGRGRYWTLARAGQALHWTGGGRLSWGQQLAGGTRSDVRLGDLDALATGAFVTPPARFIQAEEAPIPPATTPQLLIAQAGNYWIDYGDALETYATVTARPLEPGGGVITATNSLIRVDFPAGSVNATSVVSVTVFPELPYPGEPRVWLPGTALALSATTAGTPISRFTRPYTLTLPYELPPGVLTSTIALYRWDGARWSPAPCGGCRLDPAARVLITAQDATGAFALLGARYASYLSFLAFVRSR